MLDRARSIPAAEGKRFDVAGNGLRLMFGGAERRDALIQLIDGAERSLRILYYIFKDDESGRLVRDALERACVRGVHVSLIVDGFGSAPPGEFFRSLEAHGAQVCHFLPRFGRRYLLRNHQKLALADGETEQSRVIIGGFNVEDSYFSDDPAIGWRDLGLLVEGPAAGRLVGYFDGLAQWVRTPRARMRSLRRALARWSEPEGQVRWLFGGPTRRLSPWARAVKRDMRDARRLAIVAAYFAPIPAMLRRIERVARRGGEAIVLTAAKSDNIATVAAARHLYHRLLRRGVRVFEYECSKLHTKLFQVDDVVHVGSANFDVRSLFLNLELMLRVEDAAFAAELRRYVASELTASREIRPEQHERASWLTRLRWAAAYFAVAVLDINLTRRLNFGLDGE